jgi:hypothetical protein
VLSNQARYPRERVTVSGEASTWTRAASCRRRASSATSGNALTFRFCPKCGSTVYWEGQGFPGFVAVAIGTFADPNFPGPTLSIWEATRHDWVDMAPDGDMSHARGGG